MTSLPGDQANKINCLPTHLHPQVRGQQRLSTTGPLGLVRQPCLRYLILKTPFRTALSSIDLQPLRAPQSTLTSEIHLLAQKVPLARPTSKYWSADATRSDARTAG